MNPYAKVGVIVVGVLVGLGIIGSTVLTIHRPDASATFVQQVTGLIGLVTVAGGVFYGFSKQSDRLDGIEKNTNGRLSSRDDRIAELERIVLDNGLDPHTGQPVTATTVVSAPVVQRGQLANR